jgi:hypothetical protein
VIAGDGSRDLGLMLPSGRKGFVMSNAEVLQPEAIVEQLRALREHIPEYVQLPAVDARSLRRASIVSPPFVQATLGAAAEYEAVASLIGRPVAEQRQEAIDADRWAAVENEARALVNGITASNLVRRHRIGLTALQTYSICQQLVRQKEHARLLPHVKQMKGLNKFARTRAKVPSSPTQPAPEPAPPAQPARPPDESPTKSQ